MKKLLFIAFIICLCAGIKANNITITNISVVPASNTIKFDVSWDNGWRSNTLNNWDAAWVFFKYYDLSGTWRHIYLTNAGNVIPGGFTGTVVSAGIGVFLFRTAAGSGITTLPNVQLGIPADKASGIFDIKAFAIEMVYVPTAPFFQGDGSSTNAYALFSTPINSTTTSIIDPLATPTNIYSTTFPNGYSAFYCMKYELSQGGYRDFLNSLSYSQQVTHILPAPSAITGTNAFTTLPAPRRNYIEIKTPGVAFSLPAVFGCDANNNNIYDEADDGEWVPCNFLTWVDHAAYLAWAGLRPLTELEYEKAARGIQLPVAGEYVWGNTNIFTGPPYYTHANNFQASEVATNAAASPTGNAYYFGSYSLLGPVRNGIFATATSNRISSGGSFYGVMELSGNLVERVVTTVNTQGRAFTGSLGGVELGGDGFANLSFTTPWPGTAGSGSIDGSVPALGLIYRGGGWGDFAPRLRTSDRVGLVVTDSNTDRVQLIDVGVRGCRSPN